VLAVRAFEPKWRVTADEDGQHCFAAALCAAASQALQSANLRLPAILLHTVIRSDRRQQSYKISLQSLHLPKRIASSENGPDDDATLASASMSAMARLFGKR